MPKAESSKRSLVSILDKTGAHAGFGVYIGDDFVLTCAHILQEDDGAPVTQDVRVQFVPTASQPFPARVIKAKPPVLNNDRSWQSGDVALLKLGTPAPQTSQAAPLVSLDSLPDSWLVLGFLTANPKVTEVNGSFKISIPLPELRGPKDEDIAIEPGFSGSPVFDEGADQVIGLVRSGISRWDKHGKPIPVRQSYMLPIKTIVSELQSADLENRLANRFVRLSTISERKNHNEVLGRRIEKEQQERDIEFTFDCRISEANNVDKIRHIHSQAIIESYPSDQQTAADYWSISDFLRDLTREKRRLDSAIFHLQAPGGSGKSVLARKIVQSALADAIVPYCIEISRSQTGITIAGDKPEYKLEDLFKGTIAGGAKFLRDDLEANRLCLLLADGLNEAASGAPKWLALLRQLAEDYPNLRILICDRIVDRSTDLPNAQLLTVRPLSSQAINGELAKAGKPAITDPKLLDLLSTPFFLHLALPSKNAGKRPAGIQGTTRTEVFQEYFRMALELPVTDSNTTSQPLGTALDTLSNVAYQAYTKENHLVIDASLWDKAAVNLKPKLEQAGALLAAKRANQTIGDSFRHQLLHDYLAGQYLSKHAPPDYDHLHGATWRGENPEPVSFALEIIGSAGSDSFLNRVYDWNYSVTIGYLRDAEKSQQPTVSDCFKGAVAALIALKTADVFVETRRAGEQDLKIFDKGLAGYWREAVTAAGLNDPNKIENLLNVVQEKFPVEICNETSVVDYALWKKMFCRKDKPSRGEESSLFVDNPLMGWTAANSFRRTGVDLWFFDSLKGAYGALRQMGVSSLDGRHDPAARVVRRRIVYVLGTAQDGDTVALLERVVFDDQNEDEDVKTDGLRSLLEIASRDDSLRANILGRIKNGMPNLAPRIRRRILRSHRIVKENRDWLIRMLDLISLGADQESDQRHRAAWESAKIELVNALKS